MEARGVGPRPRAQTEHAVALAAVPVVGVVGVAAELAHGDLAEPGVGERRSTVMTQKKSSSAKNTSTRQIAKNAVKGGPKDAKKDKRMGIGKR